ncbi:alpha-2-macroglobulin family N-region [Streptomyces laurentii]|uniref:Alpha-2-macroglobulin family N-region n=1 Tax=Streptomyces laurentii TaxID=39478 RepID=A0A169PT02_STRLU|nr:alpha-2-macroglobulin family N-region [Streptomyces laurentii]
MTTQHVRQFGVHVRIHPALVEEREEHRDMGRDPGLSRGVEPLTPPANGRLRLRDPHDKSCLTCPKPATAVICHDTA